MYVKALKQTDFCVLFKESEKEVYYVTQKYSFNQDGFMLGVNENAGYYVNVASDSMDIFLNRTAILTNPILLRTVSLDEALEKIDSTYSFV